MEQAKNFQNYGRSFEQKTFLGPKNVGEYESEIYTVKDANQKKLNDLFKHIKTRGDIPRITLKKEDKIQNQRLIESLKDAADLYFDVNDLVVLKNEMKSKMDKKYQSFKNYYRKTQRKERLQQIIDAASFKISEKNLK